MLYGAAKCGKGKPEIKKDFLEYLIDADFKIKDISKMFLVGERTVYRKIAEYNISREFSNLSDQELDVVVLDIKKVHPNVGETLMKGFLLNRGIRIQRERIRSTLHRVDAGGVGDRRRRTLHRRQYIVPGANSMWHIDGHHKLIR